MHRSLLPWLRRLGLTILIAAQPVFAAEPDYFVVVDTSTLNGSIGYLDFQLNPGVATAAAVTAQIEFGGLFTTVLQGGPIIEGDVVLGSPPPLSFTMINSTAFNDLLQPVQFGHRFDFRLRFSGDFLTASGGDATAFALTLLGPDQTTTLLTTDPNGTIATFDLAPGGNIAISTFSASPVLPSVVSISPVPEASEYMMMLAGLLLVGAVAKNNRSRCG